MKAKQNKAVSEKVVPKHYLNNRFSKFLIEKRMQTGLNVTAASKEIGISRRTLSRLESSWDVSIYISSLVKMAEVYHFRFSDFDRYLYSDLSAYINDSAFEGSADDYKTYSENCRYCLNTLSNLEPDQVNAISEIIRAFKKANNKKKNNEKK